MNEFSRLTTLIGEDNMEKLKNTTVLVLGLGGVGGYAVEALARSGIGKLILVDKDYVEITNFNRQIIADSLNIGKSKAEAFKKRIAHITQNCEVQVIFKQITPYNLEELFTDKVDYVIDAIDDIPTKKALICYLIQKDIPFISSMGMGKKVDPTKVQIMELMKTSYDPLAREMRKMVKEENIHKKIYVVCSSESPRKKQEKVIASSIFVPAYAGLLCANYVFLKVLGEWHG